MVIGIYLNTGREEKSSNDDGMVYYHDLMPFRFLNQETVGIFTWCSVGMTASDEFGMYRIG